MAEAAAALQAQINAAVVAALAAQAAAAVPAQVAHVAVKLPVLGQGSEDVVLPGRGPVSPRPRHS